MAKLPKAGLFLVEAIKSPILQRNSLLQLFLNNSNDVLKFPFWTRWLFLFLSQQCVASLLLGTCQEIQILKITIFVATFSKSLLNRAYPFLFAYCRSSRIPALSTNFDQDSLDCWSDDFVFFGCCRCLTRSIKLLFFRVKLVFLAGFISSGILFTSSLLFVVVVFSKTGSVIKRDQDFPKFAHTFFIVFGLLFLAWRRRWCVNFFSNEYL